MNPVLISDLEARFRPLLPTEEAPAQAWLDDAWEEVLARVPNVVARIDSGELSSGLVRKVVAAMVVRVLRNPGGVKQWSVDNGDYSETRDSSQSAGLLYLSDDELALLGGGDADTVSLSFSGKYIW